MKAKLILSLLAVCLVNALLGVYFIARRQLATRIRVPIQSADLSFSSIEFSRAAGIQIYFRASASADARIKVLLTRVTPAWSLIPIEQHRARWLVNIYTGSGTYWDDEALTK